MKNVAHLAQLINHHSDHGAFRKFDYKTPEANIEKYGQATPPDWPLEKIPSEIPITMICGQLDGKSATKDIVRLENILKGRGAGAAKVNVVWLDGWDHESFLTARGPDAYFEIIEKKVLG
jgi:hypothetical protein